MHTHSRIVRLAAALLIAPACHLLAAAPKPASERPNILFIMTDDHASHAISAYGSKVNLTPNLDKLGSDGGTGD